MERKTVSDFPPEVMGLFQHYVHGYINRREFLDGAAKYAVAGFSAVAMLEALRPNFAYAQQVAKDDKRIKTEYLSYAAPAEGSGVQIRAYLARPAAAGKFPGVMVFHENRGLNPYIEDICRRFALINYVAFAPDALSPLGGYPNDEEKAAAMYRQLDPKKRLEDQLSGAAVLKARAEFNGKMVATGFCAGGGVALQLAARAPDLVAAAPFYGPHLNAAETAKVKAPLLLNYASDDPFLAPGWPAFEALLKSSGTKYTAHIYPGTQHGFFNDTTPRYVADQSKIAWQRTVEFFNQHLRG